MTQTPTFSKLYAFGDSLSDAGNLSLLTKTLGTTEPVSPPYYRELYSTALGPVAANVFSNGPTWVQDLSVALGLGVPAPSAVFGTDFAFGGAETGSTPQNGGNAQLMAISLPAQLQAFNTAFPSPAANALYTVSIGANDLLDIFGSTGLSAAQQTADVQAAVSNEITFISGLAKDGAKNVLVMNVPDLGKTPEVMSGAAGGVTPATASQLTALYDSDLSTQLGTLASADSLDVHILDAYALLDNAVANPGSYGLTNVTSPVWSGNYTSASSGTLAATGTAQNQYLFWDHLHPTETGQQALANAALAVLSAPPCYAAGTRIATERGEVGVEDLRVGDRVRLADGGSAPVTWLGHRSVDCRRHPRPEDVWPVRVAAHAFGLGRPQRDVLLSPDHAVFVDGVLIPVRYLLNDATVRQEAVDAVTYWHVELPAHGVLLAEGLPAESYLDTGNRAAFIEGGSVVTAHPDFARAVWHAKGCAKLVSTGAKLAAIKSKLLRHAAKIGHRLIADPDLHLRADGTRIDPVCDGTSYRFLLPHGIGELQLVSRRAIPAYVVPESEDCRPLGVALAQFVADGRALALDDAAFGTGWYAAEPHWRWTDGNASLQCSGVTQIRIRVVPMLSYWDDTGPVRLRSRAAL